MALPSSGEITMAMIYQEIHGTAPTSEFTLADLVNASILSDKTAPHDINAFLGYEHADVTAPSTPTGLVVTLVSASSVSLDWQDSSDDRSVAGYEVYMNGTYKMTVTGSSAIVTGLNDVTTYSFKVRAKDGVGNYSGFSSSVNATTADGTAPSQVTGLSAVAVAGTPDVNLGWNAASDNVGVTSYEISYSTSTDAVGQVAGSATTSTRIYGLTEYTYYYFKARAVDADGNYGPYSTIVSVRTSGDSTV